MALSDLNPVFEVTAYSRSNILVPTGPMFTVHGGTKIRIFRLDALAKALSVIATATWLGGWLAGWLGVCHTPVLYQNG